MADLMDDIFASMATGVITTDLGRNITLFNRAAEAPEYIVKMTRDPALNPRLENEHRALALLGWQPTVPLDEGLAATVAWFADEADWNTASASKTSRAKAAHTMLRANFW